MQYLKHLSALCAILTIPVLAFAESIPIDNLASLIQEDWLREQSPAADVITQAQALATRLGILDSFSPALDELTKRVNTANDPQSQQECYLQARQLKRQIAFSNPLLLNLPRILFIKRHHAKGVFHMCDQYYGFNAVPGGGIYTIDNPFSPNPTLTSLIDNSLLPPGAFLSPELSYDAQTLYFAYTQATGKDLEWSPSACYHLFKINTDGAQLTQLTNGPWDDFDPCVLPNGRIAFISERRGGYLRCGRHCPTYTLFGMNPDGSDIICLSFHETHEWQPSVNNDGMIVYTRWDYVDRDTNIAHHLWTCYPDGRDPRSFHGNYPTKRESRPWMEMSIRAIPNSNKYIATAAAHHGHAFGSLILIDPRPQDDGAMSQITRITPEVPFPESEKNIRPIQECMVYATPYPLSEDDYLCAYDPQTKNQGIYWIDRYGNRELIYRDPAIPSIDPIPFLPRPTPPIIPVKTTQTAAIPPQQAPPATVTILNIYNSDFTWPENTRITSLRIIQVLPKTTPPPNEPRIGIGNQTNARAILGAVPVETDGSAHFQLPPGKEVYFQALDAQGCAIQSMRSGTYTHPGEHLTCAGCHEPKASTPASEATPLALKRPPSVIQPGPPGTNPFSYPRLVQPVLDQHCVPCHQQQNALDLTGPIEGPNGWSRSYNNLAEKFAFYYNVSNGSINDGIHGGSRSIPGKNGALAAPLLPYLTPEHCQKEIPPQDLHRILCWLDANAEFYGAYENAPAQSYGQIIFPTLD